jgi:hypothetical protein
MGLLKPGATYIYERADDRIYSREVGSDERTLVGYYMPNRPAQYDLIETQLWQDIVYAGKSNPTLQKVLDRAVLIYQTVKDETERKTRP